MLREENKALTDLIRQSERQMPDTYQQMKATLQERSQALMSELEAANARAEAALAKQLDLQEEKRRLSRQMQQVLSKAI